MVAVTTRPTPTPEPIRIVIHQSPSPRARALPSRLYALASLAAAAALLLPGSSAEAQARVPRSTVIDGSPAPTHPVAMTRDARGRPTVRAIRLDEPLTLDGVLDEAI